ncbi:MAG: SUMF1/EgtB/PvdO family nonheme iron enzyme [Anaerolineae bacterium]
MVTAQQTKAAVSGQEIARGDLVARLGLDPAQVEQLLTRLRAARVIRKFGDEERYELAHEVMVSKVWAWMGEDELRLLDVRDLLRRELSNYQKFGHLLTQEKLALLTPVREALRLDRTELELVLRSALTDGVEASYWAERARKEDMPVDAIATEGLKRDSFRTRAAAATILGQLGARFIPSLIPLLADAYPQARLAAIWALERVQPSGEWRAHLKYECYVPAGEFIMGDDKGSDDEKPAHRVSLDAYYIGRYPVTNSDYKRYRDDRGEPFKVPTGKANHPVVEVSWYQARDYCAWAGMRLPTEAEWEKTASWDESAHESGVWDRVKRSVGASGRSSKKRQYPWGDEFDSNKCNTSESGIGTTTPVGKYSPAGDSPYGAADMAGNVWEWCADWYAGDYYKKSPAQNPQGPDSGESRVVRGGAFHYLRSRARCAYRFNYPPNYLGDAQGFRVAASLFRL